MSSSLTDRILIEGSRAETTSAEGVTSTLPLERFVQALSPPGLDSGGLIFPDGTVMVSSRGPFTVVVNQIPPRVYPFRWVEERSRARFGPGTRYAQVRISLPYLLIYAVYHNGVLTHLNECFFRTRPLATEDDPVCYPALLNCSKFSPPDGKPLAWICTQHMDPAAIPGNTVNERIRSGFQALRHCLIETGFNESSEYHEGSSWYAESKNVDPRIGSIRAWEKAAEKDPLFVLDVPWLPTGHSVRQVIERIFRNQGAQNPSASSACDLARLIFNAAP
jgi:hypothetical protein